MELMGAAETSCGTARQLRGPARATRDRSKIAFAFPRNVVALELMLTNSSKPLEQTIWKHPPHHAVLTLHEEGKKMGGSTRDFTFQEGTSNRVARPPSVSKGDRGAI